MQTPGERLQTLRNARGLTQEQLSELSGIDRGMIAKIETGARRMTGTEVIYLAESLDTQPANLIGGAQRQSYYRGSGDVESPAAQAMSAWFEDYIDDALFLERTASHYGLE